MRLTDQEIDQVQEWGKAHDPRECGGVILNRGRHRRLACLQNIAVGKNDLRHRPADIAATERDGWVIQGYWHTHVRQSVEPSQADRVGCKATGLPWVIVGYPNRRQTLINPDHCLELSLLGREFSHGSVDCYTLIRDYYIQHLGVTLPDYYREDDWWDKGQNVYLDCLASNDDFDAIDFRDHGQLQQHDILLIKINCKRPNHGAVYIGASKMLHHFMGRKSERVFYSPFYAKRTAVIARHKAVADLGIKIVKIV